MNTDSVLFARVSSREQEESGYSLDSQENLLKEYTQKKNLRADKAHIFRVSESASAQKQRKIFNEMMNLLDSKGIKILICEKTDRLTRSRRDAVLIDDWVRSDPEREVHFVKENFILTRDSRANEKFMWGIKVEVAQYYINNLSEDVKKGQKEKIAQGWLPTKPPLGYKTIGDKGRKVHVLDESKAPFIRKAFEYYASGNYSIMALVELLYKEGLRTRAGYKLAKSRLDEILADPFYYGALRWNNVVYKNGSHEPLVSKELFDKVQDVKSGRRAPAYKSKSFQFRKMLKCGECEGTITAEIQKGIVYYHCTHYKGCTQKKYTPEKKLEEQLLGVFKFFENITPAEAEEIRSKIKANHAQEIEYKENTINALNTRWKALQRRLEVLYDDRLDERITLEQWEVKQKEITEEQTSVQAEISRLKDDEAKYFEIWLNILDLATRAREIYLRRSPEERRILLSHIFSNLVLKDEKVAYTLTKPVEKLAERVQQRIDQEKTFEPRNNVVNKRQKDSFESLSPVLLRR